MKKKMLGFDFNELNNKLKAIILAGDKDFKDFKVNELIPNIFSIEKIK